MVQKNRRQTNKILIQNQNEPETVNCEKWNVRKNLKLDNPWKKQNYKKVLYFHF